MTNRLDVDMGDSRWARCAAQRFGPQYLSRESSSLIDR